MPDIVYASKSSCMWRQIRKFCVLLLVVQLTSNLRGILNAWHFCFYFKFNVYGTMR